MAQRYMLDTNVLSDLIKNPTGPVAQQARRGQDRLCTSLIVAAELRYGCAKKNSPHLTRKVEDLLRTIPVLALGAGVDQVYGRIRAALEGQGQVIGGNDLLIAAHAIHEGVILVTANQREFARVPGLVTEDWNYTKPR